MKVWIKAMRLRTLPLSFASILVGSAVAYSASRYSGGRVSYDWTVFALCLVTTLLLQILSNFANDYGDFVKGTDNAERAGPERALQSGSISKGQMKIALFISSACAFLSGLTLLIVAFWKNDAPGFWLFLGIGIGSIAAAVLYTIGRRAYGYLGFGDFFVFLFFGPVGIMGSTYLISKMVVPVMICFSVTVGAFAVAVLNLNNMRDIVGDEKSGKKTIPVRLGFRRAKVYHFLLFTIAYCAFLIPYLIFQNRELGILLYFSPVAILHFIHLLKVYHIAEPAQLDGQLKAVALSSFLFSLILFGLAIFL